MINLKNVKRIIKTLIFKVNATPIYPYSCICFGNLLSLHLLRQNMVSYPCHVGDRIGGYHYE